MKFGTDGVRGKAGQPPLDSVTITRLGAALVRSFLTAHERAHQDAHPISVVCGRDTRESGVWMEEALARGVAAAGGRFTSLGIMPTPGVAYVTKHGPFDLGVVISASHNPFEDNGIKVFSGKGEKFGDAEERDVEDIVNDASWQVAAVEPAVELSHLIDDYLAHTRRLLPDAGPLRGSRVAIDMGHGATTATAPQLFRALGFDVIELGNAPDGRNINLGCGSTHPEPGSCEGRSKSVPLKRPHSEAAAVQKCTAGKPFGQVVPGMGEKPDRRRVQGDVQRGLVCEDQTGVSG